MSAAKDYLSSPLRELLADIAAKSPTPGGGSVAAVTGALSASLACMAIEYTIGKPKFAEYAAQLRAVLDECKRASEEFARLIAEDMQAYEAVLASRGLEPAVRDQAAAQATAVPLEIVALAGALLVHLDAVKGRVNTRLLGDLQASATLAAAAAQAAGCTVRDNLATMPDRHEAMRLLDRLDLLLGRIQRHCNAVVHYLPA